MKNNPYVGPRPYERQDRHNFYGRNREARELRSLILSEREVLFYAQSGAGKTSLLNARVVPDLEAEGFTVLPVVRVGSELPSGIDPQEVDNVFVFSQHGRNNVSTVLFGDGRHRDRGGIILQGHQRFPAGPNLRQQNQIGPSCGLAFDHLRGLLNALIEHAHTHHPHRPSNRLLFRGLHGKHPC